MKKYLTVLAGNPRGGEHTWKSLYKYVIDHLDSDLAICTGDIWVSENSLFEKADYKWRVIGLLFGLLSHISRAYRWLFMLEPLGYKIKFGNSVMAVFAAYLINFTIPRAGEVARASILTNYEKVPFEKGFGTIVSERIADLILMAGIIFITLFLQFDFIYSFNYYFLNL